MSLACLECGRIGSFDTLILFHPEGEFDRERTVSDFRNFYTCCVSISDFAHTKESRFLIVQTENREELYFTGKDGAFLRDTKVKQIDEAELRARLPKTFEALTRTSDKR